MATDVVSQIVDFFRSKGLNDKAIAGILGNLQTESGFNTGAYNAREGAIGLAQWEGGRRTALQQFAARMGTTETDLHAQLGYMWQEMQGRSEDFVRRLNASSDAGAAAALWDQEFEVSSGEARGQRVAQAQQFASNGLRYTGQPVQATFQSYTTPTGGGGGAVAATPQQHLSSGQMVSQAGLGPYLGLFNSVPELQQLMATAVNSGQDPADFADAVYKSKWWSTHSDGVRKQIALQTTDPAEWKVQYNQAVQYVIGVSKQMGVPIGPTDAARLATLWQAKQLDPDQLKRELATVWSRTGYNSKTTTGAAAQLGQQLKQLAASYGLQVSDASLNGPLAKLLSGDDQIETYKQQYMNAAMSAFPGLAKQLSSGMTLEDIASPYKSSMASILEVDPSGVNTLDPTIRKALQGSDQNGRQPVALWQFEQTLRQDPRWQQTNNAKQDYANALYKIGKDWGFSG